MNQTDTFNRSSSYMLRRTLCPWNWQQISRDTLDFCEAIGIEEVMWITECTGMYHELLPITAIEQIVETLHPIKNESDARGIRFSINPLTTLGHGHYGNDLRGRYPEFEPMVDYRGGACSGSSCPRSPWFQQLMADTFASYATTQPVRLWLEDDFRLWNHTPGVQLGCYCPRCLAEFAELTGVQYDRETLVARLLQPGPAHPLRRSWMDFQSGALNTLAERIKDGVQTVSPQTQMGWMSTNSYLIDIEGRSVSDQLQAISGANGSAIRMSVSAFREHTPRDIYWVDEGLKRMLPQLPESTLRTIEVENFPGSVYSKSAAMTLAQITWSTILQAPHATLNIYDYLGSPFEHNPLYGERLKAAKPWLKELASAFAGSHTAGAVEIPLAPEATATTETTEGKSVSEWNPREGGWSDPLRAFGIPLHWGKGTMPLTAMTGQGPRLYTEEELHRCFSGGVLLDSSALETMAALGKADWCGVQPGRTILDREQAVGSELLTDPAFGGGPHHYTWSLGTTRKELIPSAAVREISVIQTPDEQKLIPGFCLFENPLGGRVAVAPYALQGKGVDPFDKGPPVAFYSMHRRNQMVAILNWLAHGRLATRFEAPGWILPHRADCNGAILLAAMNLNNDPWQGISAYCHCAHKPVTCERLLDDGNWQPEPSLKWDATSQMASIHTNSMINPYATVVWRLRS